MIQEIKRAVNELTASEGRMYNYWRNIRKLKHEDALELAILGFNGKSGAYERRKREILSRNNQ